MQQTAEEQEQKKLNAKLYIAIEEGNTKNVIHLIESGANVNARDENDNAALDIAAQIGNVETIEALIRLGANVNAQDKLGNTPLHHAFVPKRIEALIRLGANVDARDEDDQTPLHRNAEIFEDSAKSIETLIRLGANVNAQDKLGNTPLHLVAIKDEEGYIENAEALIRLGADVNAQNANGDTPLHYIKKMIRYIGFPDPMIKFLLEHKADTSIKDNKGDSLNSGTHSIIQKMNQIIENINQEQKRFNDIKEYIEKSSEINAEELVAKINRDRFDDKKKFSLIEIVFNTFVKEGSEGIGEKDFAKIVKGIFKKDIDKARCLALFIRRETSVQTIGNCNDIEGKEGSSEIRRCMNEFDVKSDMAKEIIFTQCILNIGDSIAPKIVDQMKKSIGITNLDNVSTMVKNNTAIEEGVKSKIIASISFDRMLMTRDDQYCRKTIEELISNKNHHIVDPRGHNLLHYVAKHGQIDLMKELLDAGLNRNSPNQYDETPLYIAASAGKIESVRVLLEANANVNSCNNRGNAPIHSASDTKDDDNTAIQILKALIEKGANVNLANEDGITPLQIAVLGCNTSTIKLLLENGANTDSFTKGPLFAEPNKNKTLIEVIALNKDISEPTKIINFNELFKHGAEINTQFLEDPNSDISDDIRNYLRQLDDIEKRNKELHDKYVASILNGDPLPRCNDFIGGVILQAIKSIKLDEIKDIPEIKKSAYYKLIGLNDNNDTSDKLIKTILKYSKEFEKLVETSSKLKATSKGVTQGSQIDQAQTPQTSVLFDSNLSGSILESSLSPEFKKALGNSDVRMLIDYLMEYKKNDSITKRPALVEEKQNTGVLSEPSATTQSRVGSPIQRLAGDFSQIRSD